MNCTWIIHQICDGESITYHTHGLDEYGSLELELNFALAPEQAGLFMNLIASSIAEGRRYHSGQCVTEIFTLPFYLFETSPIEGTFQGERVLRIIFCDEGAKFPWDIGCNPDYRNQLFDIEIREMEQILQIQKGKMS